MILALMALASSFGEAGACYAPPPELFQPHGQLIDATPVIVLAEVVRREPLGDSDAGPSARFFFRTSTVLKGEAERQFAIQGAGDLDGHWSTTFEDHAEEEFWANNSGRVGISGDCALTPLTFEVGKQYLLFLGGPPDTKIAEQVVVDSDRWFVFVREKL